MFQIGCHLSIADGFLSAAKTIIELGGNTFQYFSRNPQGGKAKAWDEEDFLAYRKYAEENGIRQILCHAPYTLNPCSQKENVREFATICFKEDLVRLERFGNALYNFHPGSKGSQELDISIDEIADVLNEVMTPDMTTTILLETMSGKGTEVGRSFEECRAIIDKLKYPEHIGITLDTCHVYSAGYDLVNDLDGVLKHFDEVLGIGRLKAIHLNDSKTEFASNKDRHEKIGAGSLGSDAILRIINHPLLRDLPFYLETPNEMPGYKDEIAFLKANRKED